MDFPNKDDSKPAYEEPFQDIVKRAAEIIVESCAKDGKDFRDKKMLDSAIFCALYENPETKEFVKDLGRSRGADEPLISIESFGEELEHSYEKDLAKACDDEKFHSAKKQEGTNVTVEDLLELPLSPSMEKRLSYYHKSKQPHDHVGFFAHMLIAPDSYLSGCVNNSVSGDLTTDHIYDALNNIERKGQASEKDLSL